MATIIPLTIPLKPIPSSYKAPSSSTISPTVSLPIYPAGPSYLSHARRHLLQRTFAEDDKEVQDARDKLAAELDGNAEQTLYPGLGEEQEDAATLAQDPKEWKKQDHYAILGLGGLRYKANDEQIKVAHRRKVLRHHPDKKAGANAGTNDDAFFKCIQKAHETLTNGERRRQFDSVDWNIEDSIPDLKKIPADKYCETVAPILAREGRFSKIQPVPGFGGSDASKAEVEGFYDFWYNFDSWRSFEWHDKEVNEGSDSRDDKRFTEKKNKSERTRRKKEDNTRVRELIDLVLANDPRIKRIKEEEKAARNAKKKGGPVANGTPTKGKPLSPAEKKAAEEKQKKEAAAKAEEDKKNAEKDKADREVAKKAKEAARKNLKKWKKSISTVIASSNYFAAEGTTASPQTIEKVLNELDTLCELLEPEEVKELKEKVEAAGAGQKAKEELKSKAEGLGEKGQGKFTELTA